MIKRSFEKLKALCLYFVSNNKLSVGCGTCEYKHLLMSDKPCLNCNGRYTEWKQTTDLFMNKFYFQHRNIGLDSDTNKYYFSTIDELINQVEVLRKTENEKCHFKWSISKMSSDNKYALMSEFWTIEKRGTDMPLKCKGWWVCGYIYTDETNVDLHQTLPKFEADYANHFIEIRYMSADDLKGLSDLEKQKCSNDGGIILNRKSFDAADM